MATFAGNPPASALTGAEVVPGVQGGVDVRMTAQDIADLAATNLSYSRTTTDVTVQSDTGDDVALPPASSSYAGVMTAADKAKLDSLTAATIRTATANDVAVIGDANNVVQMDVATSNTFTVPPNSSVAFPIGSSLELWQKGAGQTTVTGGSGVTILYHASLTLKLKGQNSGASLRKVATDTWRLVGDMEAAP
jgi:hypothetical protein